MGKHNIRFNVLAVLTLLAILVLSLSMMKDIPVEALVGLAGTAIGYLGASAEKLIDPSNRGSPSPGQETVEVPARLLEKLFMGRTDG